MQALVEALSHRCSCRWRRLLRKRSLRHSRTGARGGARSGARAQVRATARASTQGSECHAHPAALRGRSTLVLHSHHAHAPCVRSYELLSAPTCVCVCAARMYVAQVLLQVPVYNDEACLSCASTRACSLQWTLIGHTLDIHWTYIGHYIGHWEIQGFARLKKTPCFSCNSPFFTQSRISRVCQCPM